MHHKRRRHKAARAGCLMCKPHKRGGHANVVSKRGFGNLRREALAVVDLKQEMNAR